MPYVMSCTNAPTISHLLFADDCFLFSRADDNEAQVMKNILHTYELASGKAINLPKSEVFFSSVLPSPLKETITNILGVRAVMGTGKISAFRLWWAEAKRRLLVL